MTDEEKRKLKHTYALPFYMREGGVAGDVDPADVQAIYDKYEPLEADRRAYQKAKREGKLEDYWAARKGTYEQVVGASFSRPSVSGSQA